MEVIQGSVVVPSIELPDCQCGKNSWESHHWSRASGCGLYHAWELFSCTVCRRAGLAYEVSPFSSIENAKLFYYPNPEESVEILEHHHKVIGKLEQEVFWEGWRVSVELENRRSKDRDWLHELADRKGRTAAGVGEETSPKDYSQEQSKAWVEAVKQVESSPSFQTLGAKLPLTFIAPEDGTLYRQYEITGEKIWRHLLPPVKYR